MRAEGVPKVVGQTTPARFRLIAAAFAIGALVHAAGFIAAMFGVHWPPQYPAWRHAAFTAADGTIAYVAARHPRHLIWLLIPFLAEQGPRTVSGPGGRGSSITGWTRTISYCSCFS